MQLDLTESLRLNFFREHGYIRKKCPICGKHFWTTNPDRKTCGEAPCEPYTFIDRKLLDRSIDQVREDFLSFMEREGHTRVNRYPVVCRWRDDLFLTSASIVDFQPFITAGLVPPPANPLTISQPCIRMKDVDKVGLTLGRHLTIFEMMAHHAFNTRTEKVYWKERTLELFHKYALEVLGLREDEITYKEGIWRGGGNAGPDVEPIAGGLEIATLVFMEYKEENGMLRPMETKVVDTGYGLERITWFLRGGPTAFDVVYEGLVKKFFDLLGVKRPEEKILLEYSRISSLMSKIEAGESLWSLRKRAAESMEMSLEELDSLLTPMEMAFAVLDHTKAVAFMLADGLVPSNVQEGYLGRLLIRRTLRLLKKLEVNVELSELIDMQLDHWSKAFPDILEAKDNILEIVNMEQRRFEETLRRGRNTVLKEVKRRRKIDMDFLIEVYDSHGIPPELVEEIAKERGIEVKVPDNFYELVAARHERPEIRPPEIPESLEQIRNFKKTELLFYENPYSFEFKAKVLGVVGDALILDRTIFYPEGGGQPCDIGIIKHRSGDFHVFNVEKVAGRVLHHVTGDLSMIRPGDIVRGRIDWDRRAELMRNHTATHIILGAARKILGKHVWQSGAQKGVSESRLDVTHYKSLSDEDLLKIELEANRVIMENREVKTFWMPRTDAEKKYGFVLYQGGVVPDPILRVVEIEGFNVQACAGTHIRRTGEIGFIKIWKSRRIQDGVVRLEFSAGESAVKRTSRCYVNLKRIADKMGVHPEKTYEHFEKILEENRRLSKELHEERVKRLMDKLHATLDSAERVNDLRAAVLEDDVSDRNAIIEALDNIVGDNSDVIVMVLGPRKEGVEFHIIAGKSAVDKGVGANLVAKRLTDELGGGGGGSRILASGLIKCLDVRRIKCWFLEILRRTE